MIAEFGDSDRAHDEVLGWHLEQAYVYWTELGDQETDLARETAARAARHLVAAGRRALDRDDVSSAASCLDRACRLITTTDPDYLAVLRDKCDALVSTGDVHAALEAVNELATRARDEREHAIADV